MRTSKAKLAYIITNINQLTLIQTLYTRSGATPDVDNCELRVVVNVLDSHQFFKNIGQESITITEEYNGDSSLLIITVNSMFDSTTWSKRVFTLQCDTDFIYNLSNQ